MAIFYENQNGNVWVRADQIKRIIIDETRGKFRVVLKLAREKSVAFAECADVDEAVSFVYSMPERSIKL